MSFITPLITTIQNVSSDWYYNVCNDERYKGLTKTLDIPEPTILIHQHVICATTATHARHVPTTTLH